MGDWLFLIIGVLVVAALVVGGLLVSGRRRGGTPSGGTDVVAPPREETRPPVESAAAEAPAAVTALARPEGTASGLVRLRQRLAGSQGGLGRGLLGLLSRERLDEDTWESNEDVLLTADLGVAPTQQVVEGRRTVLRVEGAPGDARAALREELVKLVDPAMDRRLQVSGADGHPGV